MVSTSASSTFFLPGLETLGKTKSAEVSEYFPATRKWDRGIFYTAGLNAPYYIARAPAEKAVVVGCSGLNTHYLLNPDEVGTLNKAGISIIWMALPKIPNGMPMVDAYIRLAQEFYTSPHSPARALMTGDSPRYALTHSTGGQLFFHLLHDPATQKKLAANFSGAVHVAPYFDTAHASRDHAPKIIQTIYQKYMARHPEVPPSQRLIASTYIAWNDYMDTTSDKDHPSMDSTCGQILELQHRGQQLTANFNTRAAKTVPSIFVIGDKDNFACHKTALDVAKKVGGEIVMAPGAFHDPLKTHPQLLKHFIDKVDSCVALREKTKAETTYVPANYAAYGREDVPELDMMDTLRNSARIALQSGTRFLNSTASLF